MIGCSGEKFSAARPRLGRQLAAMPGHELFFSASASRHARSYRGPRVVGEDVTHRGHVELLRDGDCLYPGAKKLVPQDVILRSGHFKSNLPAT